jgi:hypothetical protein
MRHKVPQEVLIRVLNGEIQLKHRGRFCAIHIEHGDVYLETRADAENDRKAAVDEVFNRMFGGVL